MNKNYIKSIIRKVPLFIPIYTMCKNSYLDLLMLRNSLNKNKKEVLPIKVVFICQYIPAWNKLEQVYLSMKMDSRFEPVLLCVPSGIDNNKLLESDCTRNDTYEYFVKKNYSEPVNALIGEDKWINIRDMNPAYVFVQRPYNSFMPKQYTSKEISKYSKVCMIMYGICFSEEDIKIAINKDFFAFVSYYFAETKYTEEINIRNNFLGHKLGIQKSIFCGATVIENMMKKKGIESNSWDFSKNDFKVIWTPRWTTDLSLGGTNFLNYYKDMIDFATEHVNMDFLFRPHPLMFDNFIKTKDMTVKEIEEFKTICLSMRNVSLDSNEHYDTTFWGADVLISDISGIMFEFFVTGKPLIFCNSNMILKLTKDVEKMLEGCYIVNNKKELFECLLKIKSGYDPLIDKRKRIIKELFGDMKKSISSKILEELARVK